MKKSDKKALIRISHSVCFYILSIYFAHFIHIYIIKEPTLLNALEIIFISFALSLLVIYTWKKIVVTMSEFPNQLFERSKIENLLILEKNKIIEEQKKIIEDLKKKVKNDTSK